MHLPGPVGVSIMPIYEYNCPKCQKVFEEWVHLSEAHATVPCPVCGTPSKRVISETSFILKGGGWYVTDYGYRKGIKDEDSGTTASKPAEGAKAETKAEAAPAAGKEAAPASGSSTASAAQ